MNTNVCEGPERYFVPGLERGLLLLSQFNRQDCALTAPQLAKRLKLPRTTVFRLLVTLEALGFVHREGNVYRLGLAVLRMGFEYLASLELTQLGQPLLSRLCKEVGYSCNLVVRDGPSIIYVAKVSPPSILSSSVSLGTRLPAHATVLGRVLLSDMGISELHELYPQPRLEQVTPSTPKTVQELHTLIQRDLQMGYAFSEGFFDSSISTVALPVFGRDNKVAAALGITIPSVTIGMRELERLVRQARGVANDLSHLLGYRPQQIQPLVNGPHVAGMY